MVVSLRDRSGCKWICWYHSQRLWLPRPHNVSLSLRRTCNRIILDGRRSNVSVDTQSIFQESTLKGVVEGANYWIPHANYKLGHITSFHIRITGELLPTERNVSREYRHLVPVIFTRLGCVLGLESLLRTCEQDHCAPLLVVNKWAPLSDNTVSSSSYTFRGYGKVLWLVCLNTHKKVVRVPVSFHSTKEKLHKYWINNHSDFQKTVLSQVANVVIMGIEASQDVYNQVKIHAEFMWII